MCFMMTFAHSSCGQRGCRVAFAPPPPTLAGMRLCPSTQPHTRKGREGAAGRGGRNTRSTSMTGEIAERGVAMVAGGSMQSFVPQPQLKLTGFSRPEVPPRAPHHARTLKLPPPRTPSTNRWRLFSDPELSGCRPPKCVGGGGVKFSDARNFADPRNCCAPGITPSTPTATPEPRSCILTQLPRMTEDASI